MRKAILGISVIAILVTVALTVPAAYVGDGNSIELGAVSSDKTIMDELETLAYAQKDAVEAYNVLYNSFYASDSMEPTYPNNYGGAHIEDNILYIHIVEKEEQDLTPYQAILADYLDDVAFVDAKHSLESLIYAAEHIYSDLKAQSIDVVKCGVLESENVVTIGILEQETKLQSRKMIEKAETVYKRSLQNEIDVPVRFTSETIPNVCAGIRGGSRLVDYTVGTCGTYEGEPAIVLCGHGLSLGSALYTANSSNVAETLVGTVDFHQFADNENGDYSFVKLEEGWSVMPYVGPASSLYTITGTMDAPPQGTYVGKYGARGGSAYGTSQGPNAGLVRTFLIRTSSGGYAYIEIKGLIEVDIAAGTVEEGDSGGPVFVPNNDEAMGARFCGVVSSRESIANEVVAYYFSPYQYIRQRGFSVATGTTS